MLEPQTKKNRIELFYNDSLTNIKYAWTQDELNDSMSAVTTDSLMWFLKFH